MAPKKDKKEIKGKKGKVVEAKKRKVIGSDDVWLKHDIYPPRASTSRIITRSQTSFLRIENSNSDTDLFGDSHRHHPPKKRHLLTTMKGDFGGIPRTLMTRSTADFLSVNMKLCEEIEDYKVYMPEYIIDISPDKPGSAEIRTQSRTLEIDEPTHVQMDTATGSTSPQTVTQSGILGTVVPPISQSKIREQQNNILLADDTKGLLHKTKSTDTAKEPQLQKDAPIIPQTDTQPRILGTIGPTISQPEIAEHPSKNPLAEEPIGLIHTEENIKTAALPPSQDPPTPVETFTQPGILGPVGPTISQPIILEEPSKNPLEEEPKALIHTIDTIETAAQPLLQDPPIPDEIVTQPGILGSFGPTIRESKITDPQPKNPLADELTNPVQETESTALEKEEPVVEEQEAKPTEVTAEYLAQEIEEQSSDETDT